MELDQKWIDDLWAITTKPKVVMALCSLLISLVICIITRPSPLQSLVNVLRACKSELKVMIDQSNCGPILLRLAFADSSSYDCTLKVLYSGTWYLMPFYFEK